jgi:redox-sensitive bicupin YhaK (pirin superfamily)
VSNIEAEPDEVACGGSTFTGVLHPRDVPLGGPRAMRVRRTLPQRERALIGAWCFVDHYGPLDGPRDVGQSQGQRMDVPPHPHTGLQTVSWLFSGEIEHQDSAGVRALVRPGELNLMTAGAGICHSEVSTPDSPVLHGVQLWVALPDAHRDTGRAFAHYAPSVHVHDGARLRVFLGELGGITAPVATFTPLLGAQVDLRPHSRARFAVERGFEHGVLVDRGDVSAGGTPLAIGDLWYQSPGHASLVLANDSDGPARVLLLGGPPFLEPLVMWWNFVGRTHAEIALYRRLWEARDARFGSVPGYRGARLPSPPLPNGALRPRRNPPPRSMQT